MAKQCPNCGKTGEGKFCAECGALLNAQTCGACGNEIPEGGKFCNMCGVPVSASRRPAEQVGTKAAMVPWVLGIGAVAVLVIALILPQLSGEPEPALPAAAAGPAAGAAPPAGNPAGIDLSTMTPREAARRLNDRVMQAALSGDSAQARAFVPMALSAYQRIETPDADDRYHVASLLLVAGEPAVALTTANSILAQNPRHLLGLFVGGEAERIQGNREGAEEFFGRFLESYDSELATGLAEYAEHGEAFPAMRSQAEAYLNQ